MKRRRIFMRGLAADLAELERTNPEVRKAAEKYHRTVREILARQSGEAKPRARCPVCGRHILLINGVLRSHGFTSLQPFTSRCKGTGLTVREAP